MHIMTSARLLTVSYITLTEKLARCEWDNHIKCVGKWKTHWAKRVVASIQSPTGGYYMSILGITTRVSTL